MQPGILSATHWVEVSLSSDQPSLVLQSRPLPGTGADAPQKARRYTWLCFGTWAEEGAAV